MNLGHLKFLSENSLVTLGWILDGEREQGGKWLIAFQLDLFFPFKSFLRKAQQGIPRQRKILLKPSGRCPIARRESEPGEGKELHTRPQPY